MTLDVSFRSTAPVLALVDAVFAEPQAAAAGVVDGAALHHFAGPGGSTPAGSSFGRWRRCRSRRRRRPGRCRTRIRHLTSAPQRLAETWPRWIAHEISGGDDAAQPGRPLAAGDVLVLVRRRTDSPATWCGR